MLLLESGVPFPFYTNCADVEQAQFFEIGSVRLQVAMADLASYILGLMAG